MDLSFVDSSFIDDDFDMFMSSIGAEQDPDEPQYYQAKDEDFITQSINVKDKAEDTGEEKPEESESFDSTLLEKLKGNYDSQNTVRLQQTEDKFAFQFLLPNYVLNFFAEELLITSPKAILGTISYLICTAASGVLLLFIADSYVHAVTLCVFLLMCSMFLGVLGSWILVQEVNQDAEEDQEFVANVAGLGLWEMKNKKLREKKRNAEGTGTGDGETSHALEINTIPPGTLDFLLQTLKMKDPARERQALTKGGLSFIWLANLSFAAIGFLTCMDKHYPSKEERDLNDIQTSLVGIIGWVVVASAGFCLFKFYGNSR